MLLANTKTYIAGIPETLNFKTLNTLVQNVPLRTMHAQPGHTRGPMKRLNVERFGEHRQAILNQARRTGVRI
jgi:hypothetical protein